MFEPLYCFNPLKELIIPKSSEDYNDFVNTVSSILINEVQEKWLIHIILEYAKPSKIILFNSLLLVDCDFIKLEKTGEITLHKKIEYVLDYDNFETATQFITIFPDGKVHVETDDDDHKDEEDEDEDDENKEDEDDEDEDEDEEDENQDKNQDENQGEDVEKEIVINVNNDVWTMNINGSSYIFNVKYDNLHRRNGCYYNGKSFKIDRNKYIIEFGDCVFLLDNSKLNLLLIIDTSYIHKTFTYLDNIMVSTAENKIIVRKKDNTISINSNIYCNWWKTYDCNNKKHTQYVSILYQKINSKRKGVKSAICITDIKNGTFKSMEIKEELNCIYTISSNSVIGITNKGQVIQYFLS